MESSYVELNDEELERKVMADLANFSYDEDEDSTSQFDGTTSQRQLQGAVFDRGSIFFDDYIKRQNERMQRDQEDFEKENELYKQFLQKNNAGGQEIFDEIDKDLANLKKMTKVKVKPDAIDAATTNRVSASGRGSEQNAMPLSNSISASRMISNDNNDAMDDSYIEIEDGFGDTTKYRPDVITQSQYLAIKERAREEAQQRAQQMVFAEDKIKRQFIQEQGLLSDEDSIMSGELYEEQDIEGLPAGQVRRPLSRVDSLEAIGDAPPQPMIEAAVSTLDSPVIRKNKKTAFNNNTSNVKNSLRSSQLKYDLIMSGQKQLKSSVTASIVFKQQLEAKLEAKHDRMAQEREIFAMDNEDFLSMEYEDLVQRRAFNLKDYRLPDEFAFYNETASPATAMHLQFDDIHIGEIQFDAPLSLNSDNLLTRDSLQMCLQDIGKRRRKGGVVTNNSTVSHKQSPQPLKFVEIDAVPINHKNNDIQPTRIVIKPSNKNGRAISLAEIYRDRLENAKQKVLSTYTNSGLLQQIENISRAYEPKLLGAFVDQANEHIILQDESVDAFDESNQSQVVQSQQRSLNQVLSSDIFGTFAKKRRLEIKLERISDLLGIENLPNLETVNLSVNKISDVSAFLKLTNSRIVELSLSQNSISDYSSVRQLIHLRSLNLEMNRIEAMCDLSACVHLEQINLNSNRIKTISPSISSNKQLRRFSIFKNQVSGRIGDAFAGNLFLEELDVSRNQISCIAGLEKRNLLLKKLVASHNQISEIPSDFAFIFLVEVWLNGNKIRDLNGLAFLPCLQYLNVGENAIEMISRIPLLPNLMTLLVNFNKIAHFESLFNLLRASPNLKYLSFNANPFAQQSSGNSNNYADSDLKDLYDYLLIRHLPRITELNHVAVDRGRVKYLEKRFMSLVKSKPSLDEDTIQSFLSEFTLITRQHQFIYMQKKQRKDCLFAQTLAFYVLESTFTMEHVKRMLTDKQSKQKQQQQQSKEKLAIQCDSVFFRRDCFENKVKKSIHRIQGLALKVLYRIRLRKALYARNAAKIVQIQAWIRGCLVRRIVDFSNVFSERRRHKAAIKIQKVFRGFKLRKRKMKLFGNIKYEDDDLPELDDDWLKQPQDDFDTGLSIPQGFDVMSFLGVGGGSAAIPSIVSPGSSRGAQRKKVLEGNLFGETTTTATNPTMQENVFNIKKQQQQTQHVQGAVSMQVTKTNTNVPATPLTKGATKSVVGDLNIKQKQNLLPPISSKTAHHSQQMGALQNNNFMRNQLNSSNGLQTQQNNHTYLNTQKARLHSQRSQGDSDNLSSTSSKKEDTNSVLGNSGFSYKSEHVRKPAMSMVSTNSNQSSQVFAQQSRSSKGSLAPVKSVKVSEEEKQKIMEEWGFTKPEVVQTFAYRLEKSRRNKVKSLPLTAEQRYDKFLQASKQPKK